MVHLTQIQSACAYKNPNNHSFGAWRLQTKRTVHHPGSENLYFPRQGYRSWKYRQATFQLVIKSQFWGPSISSKDPVNSSDSELLVKWQPNSHSQIVSLTTKGYECIILRGSIIVRIMGFFFFFFECYAFTPHEICDFRGRVDSWLVTTSDKKRFVSFRFVSCQVEKCVEVIGYWFKRRRVMLLEEVSFQVNENPFFCFLLIPFFSSWLILRLSFVLVFSNSDKTTTTTPVSP